MQSVLRHKKVFVFCLGICILLYASTAIISPSLLSLPFTYKSLSEKQYVLSADIKSITDKIEIELKASNQVVKKSAAPSHPIRTRKSRNQQNFFDHIDHSCHFKVHQDDISRLVLNHFLNTTFQPEFQTSIQCGEFPLPSDLNITDTYWQVTNTTNGTFYLYNAYYDDRLAIKEMPVVRILGMINVLDPTVKTFCQFWYENVSQPLVSYVYEYRYIWNRGWGYNSKGATPYLISCKCPLPFPPKHVSLVEHKCGNANNLMEVKNKRPKDYKREMFIVSVKKLDYEDDVSLQIVEWCEILKILGVNKIEISVQNVHKNVLDVLKFYESQNLVTIKFIKFPSDLPNLRAQSWHQWIQNELISFQDTFYENLYSYEYLIPMDTDEFVMPLNANDRTWKDLLDRTIKKSLEKNETFDCYPVTNHYFLLKSSHENVTARDIPKNLYFLPNIYRTANFTPYGGNAKTFLKMDRIVTIHNHFPFSCIDKDNGFYCKLFDVAREDGELHHYRHECITDECKASMNDPVKDLSLWKYKDEILAAVKTAIEDIRTFTHNRLVFKLE